MEGRTSSFTHIGTFYTYLINIQEILHRYSIISRQIKCEHVVWWESCKGVKNMMIKSITCLFWWAKLCQTYVSILGWDKVCCLDWRQRLSSVQWAKITNAHRPWSKKQDKKEGIFTIKYQERILVFSHDQGLWDFHMWKRKCPWCNGFCHRKWTQGHEFKS